MGIIPIITEVTARGERSADLYSRLLAHRIIFLDDHIRPDNASLVVAQLLFLESQNDQENIYLYLNTPGGEVVSGLAILDVMDYIRPKVCTIVFGMAASMGSVLLSGGAKGERAAFPHAEVMIHQVKGGGQFEQASDILIHADRIREMNDTLLGILAKNCDKPFEVVKKDANRDHFFTAKEALNYGLIDYII